MRMIVVLASLLGLAACSETNDVSAVDQETIDVTRISLAPGADTDRWYTEEQVSRGRDVFAMSCAGCHGQNAESIADWRAMDTNGNFPPPPLNGTAHTWHHPLSVLKMVIEQGGEPFGGVMPGFDETLSDQQIVDLIAGFQGYWPDEVYERWLERERAGRSNQ